MLNEKAWCYASLSHRDTSDYHVTLAGKQKSNSSMDEATLPSVSIVNKNNCK